MPSGTMKSLFQERLGRYQAAIALEPTDRIPIAPGTNNLAEIYSGNSKQATIYAPEKWLEAEKAFIKAFPEVDVLRNNRFYAPLYDAVGCKTYALPGRDLGPDNQVQFNESEYMKADEYDRFIANPGLFMVEVFLPRVLGEVSQAGSMRAFIGALKGGMAHMEAGRVMRHRSMVLEQDCGMPQPMAGAYAAPFDVLADCMRGLNGIMMDVFRQPDKVIAACDAIVHEIANFALSTADPYKRYPIFVPTHKAMFLSPDQFDKYYWPSFKKTTEILIDAGYTVRAYLEGNWDPHLHRLRELPKGKVLCDIDTPGDIYKAKEVLGGYQCIAGGVDEADLILGTPQQVRQSVKHLCETVGKDGGYIISGGCHIPYDTKPENFRAMIDAVMEFGVYDAGIKPSPRKVDTAKNHPAQLNPQTMTTPWQVRKEELGDIPGEETIIRQSWERFESMAYNWIWQWVF
jgi:uroporphyrinogen-III decarboxylase